MSELCEALVQPSQSSDSNRGASTGSSRPRAGGERDDEQQRRDRAEPERRRGALTPGRIARTMRPLSMAPLIRWRRPLIAARAPSV